jgi:hypothetical protein
LLHADLLKHAGRGLILVETPGPDAMNIPVPEPEGEHRPSRFGGISLSPIVGINFVPQFGLVGPNPAYAETAYADELAVNPQRNG